MARQLSTEDYERLLELRTDLRRFLRWSETQARSAGLTPQQHQLLLAVRGHEGGGAPSITDVAEELMLRHHSVVGLVDRAEAQGLIERRPDARDGRVVRLKLTRLGGRKLESLSEQHVAELNRLRQNLTSIAEGLADSNGRPVRSRAKA